MATQDQTYKGQTNIQTTEPIRHPTPMFPVRLPVLTQQITVDFQLSQEAWNKLGRQMSEMAKTNKLLKRGVKNTYKKFTSILRQPSKKTSNDAKNPTEVDKQLNLQTSQIEIAKMLTSPLKVKLLKLITRKNTTPNTVSVIQTSNSDQNTDIDKN